VWHPLPLLDLCRTLFSFLRTCILQGGLVAYRLKCTIRAVHTCLSPILFLSLFVCPGSSWVLLFLLWWDYVLLFLRSNRRTRRNASSEELRPLHLQYIHALHLLFSHVLAYYSLAVGRHSLPILFLPLVSGCLLPGHIRCQHILKLLNLVLLITQFLLFCPSLCVLHILDIPVYQVLLLIISTMFLIYKVHL